MKLEWVVDENEMFVIETIENAHKSLIYAHLNIKVYKSIQAH